MKIIFTFFCAISLLILFIFCKNIKAEYNDYDVSGSNETERVSGSIDVDEEGGIGIVYDERGDQHHLDLDWTNKGEFGGFDKGELEGYGEEGDYYDLEAE